MRILFDQGTPVPLRDALIGHEVITAYEAGWATLRNGELLLAAEQACCEVLLTTDTNLRYQQNLASRKIAIVVLRTTRWPRIRQQLPRVLDAIALCTRGAYLEVEFDP